MFRSEVSWTRPIIIPPSRIHQERKLQERFRRIAPFFVLFPFGESLFMIKSSRLVALLVGVGSLAGLMAGCNTADNPKLADAPPFVAKPEDGGATKPPGRKEEYGSNPAYKKMQDRMEKAAGVSK